MERFFGFDLGDAESAISRLDKEGQTVPEVLSIRDSKSFITAYARLRNHDLLIGENACYNPNAVERKIRFKSKFLTDKESSKDVKSFAAGVLGELYLNGDLIKNEDCCFYIGCPAGWDKTARERDGIRRRGRNTARSLNRWGIPLPASSRNPGRRW